MRGGTDEEGKLWPRMKRRVAQSENGKKADLVLLLTIDLEST